MEPSALLGKLQSFTEGRKDKGKSGWVASIIAFFVIVIGMAAFAWVTNRRSKELARLRHEKNRREIEQKNARLEKERAANDAERHRLDEEISEAVSAVHEADVALAKIVEARRRDQAAIDSITGWDDI